MKNYRIGDHFADEFIGLSEKDIADNLENACYKRINGSYTKNLNSDELNRKKSRLAEVSIKLAEIEQKRKDYMAEIKAIKEEPTEEKNVLLEAIKHRSVRTEGDLWLFDDQEKNIMYTFDKNAICVDVRPLEPSERQQKIRMLNQQKTS